MQRHEKLTWKILITSGVKENNVQKLPLRMPTGLFRGFSLLILPSLSNLIDSLFWVGFFLGLVGFFWFFFWGFFFFSSKMTNFPSVNDSGKGQIQKWMPEVEKHIQLSHLIFWGCECASERARGTFSTASLAAGF